MARMLRARSLLLLLALLLALPACGDDGDAPPAPGIPGDAGADASTSTDGSTAPDAGTESDGSTAPDGSTEPDGSTSPDGSADGGGEDDALWAAWGTAGSTRETGVSTGGHAICNLDDVRADDLDLAAFDLEVPPFPYAASIVPDATSRCGADPDTLLYRLVNCERLSRGLSPYLCDRRMVWAARRHTLDQLENDFMTPGATGAPSAIASATRTWPIGAPRRTSPTPSRSWASTSAGWIRPVTGARSCRCRTTTSARARAGRARPTAAPSSS